MGGSESRHQPNFQLCPSHCFNPKAVATNMAFAAINANNGPIAAVEEAFATEPSLKKRVYDAIGA